MKSKLSISLFVILLISLITWSCSNKTNNRNEKISTSINAKDSVTNVDIKKENFIINQVLSSILDSLDFQIEINLSNTKDRISYDSIYIADTLYKTFMDFDELSSFFKKDGQVLNREDYQKKSNCKLELVSNSVKGGKRLILISSNSEYQKIENQEFRVYLVLSRVYFNKEEDGGIIRATLSCHKNTGVLYAALVKKNNDAWILMRMKEIAIR